MSRELELEYKRGFDAGEVWQQIVGAHRLAMQATTFLKVHQVRRGVDPGAVTRLEQTGLEHGAGRAFAVRSRDGDDGLREAQRHALRHLVHALQPHGDVLRMQALAVRQPTLK